jgi:hypothetical protein
LLVNSQSQTVTTSLGILILPNLEPLLHSGKQWLAIWLTGAASGMVGSRMQREGRRGPVASGPPEQRVMCKGGGQGKWSQVATIGWWGAVPMLLHVVVADPYPYL